MTIDWDSQSTLQRRPGDQADSAAGQQRIQPEHPEVEQPEEPDDSWTGIDQKSPKRKIEKALSMVSV